jgi:hypothetical protein
MSTHDTSRQVPTIESAACAALNTALIAIGRNAIAIEARFQLNPLCLLPQSNSEKFAVLDAHAAGETEPVTVLR